MIVDLVLPHRMQHLPKDSAGQPVPWYVAFVDGEPDYRAIREGGITDAVRFKSCWICGKANGRYAAFLMNPKCAVSHVATDPPAHRDCAQYTAQARPSTTGADVSLVWVTRHWNGFLDRNKQPLFNIGDPDQTYWYAHGRDATRDEVLESIEAAMPVLRIAAAEDGPHAAIQLESMAGKALKLAPA